MVNLCLRLCRLFGYSEDCSKQEDLMGLVKSIHNLLPLSEEAILLKVKVSLLQKKIDELEGRRKDSCPPGIA